MKTSEQVGKIAFYIGLVISIVAGWTMIGQTGLMLLALLGLLVGLLNVTARETHGFLLATLVLVTVGVALSTVFGDTIKNMLGAFIIFTAASAFIVALKEVYTMQRQR
jgi:hypothetical protein